MVRCLHELGPLAAGKLVTVTSTDARSRQRFAVGAYYLDEIGRFSAPDQVHWHERLCQADRRSATGVVRVFASSSEDIASRVRAGTFHPPLARRLLRFSVSIAPLRDLMSETLHQPHVHVQASIGRALLGDVDLVPELVESLGFTYYGIGK